MKQFQKAMFLSVKKVSEVMILAGKIFKGGYVLFGCINCLKTSYTWLGDDKKIHFVCPNCGSKTEAEITSRRCLNTKTYAPEGQVLLFMNND